VSTRPGTVCPGKAVRLEFDNEENITRIHRVASNPETQGPPVDLQPPRVDHAHTVTVELHSHHPNDKQAGLHT